MKVQITVPLALAIFLATVSIAGATLAADNDGNREAVAMQGSKVSLVQAIALAERQTGGLAYDAGVDAKVADPCIMVETNGPNGLQTTSVDGQTGLVVDHDAGAEED